MARLAAGQDAVPRDEGPLPRQDSMPGLRRLQTAQGCILRKSGREDHQRICAYARERTPQVFRHTYSHRTGHESRRKADSRDKAAAWLSRRCRSRLPHARPPLLHPLRRRKPAHQSRHISRKFSGWFPIHPRRTEYRTALSRHPQTYRRTPQIATDRQYGCDCRTRRGHHARGR